MKKLVSLTALALATTFTLHNAAAEGEPTATEEPTLAEPTTPQAADEWTWGSSASADAFYASMVTDDDRILPSNWSLFHWTIEIEDEDEYQDLIRDRVALRTLVANRVLDVCLDAGNDEDRCYSGRRFLLRSWADERSDLIAAYALALTFFEVDQDNWFSHERVLQKSSGYVSNGDRELRLYKGFISDGVIGERGLVLADLPVVLDHDERTITFWSSNLLD